MSNNQIQCPNCSIQLNPSCIKCDGRGYFYEDEEIPINYIRGNSTKVDSQKKCPKCDTLLYLSEYGSHQTQYHPFDGTAFDIQLQINELKKKNIKSKTKSTTTTIAKNAKNLKTKKNNSSRNKKTKTRRNKISVSKNKFSQCKTCGMKVSINEMKRHRQRLHTI